jgi:hypothetical protein
MLFLAACLAAGGLMTFFVQAAIRRRHPEVAVADPKADLKQRMLRYPPATHHITIPSHECARSVLYLSGGAIGEWPQANIACELLHS